MVVAEFLSSGTVMHRYLSTQDVGLSLRRLVSFYRAYPVGVLPSPWEWLIVWALPSSSVLRLLGMIRVLAATQSASASNKSRTSRAGFLLAYD